MFDVLIRGGRIIDGTGNPWFLGDIGILKDRIVAVGSIPEADAAVQINAHGKVVCPGFVDCHSHSDQTILANRQAASSLYQGVTTEFVGNCGLGFAPISERNRQAMTKAVGNTCPGVPLDWGEFAEFCDRIAEGTAINMGLLVAHGVVRRAVMGMADRCPTETEMVAMERLVDEALDAGALGISFGLEFMPGRAAHGEELRRLCAIAGRKDKITSWHVRNRDLQFLEAVDEAISVTREAGATLQLSHLSAKPGSGYRSWNRVMEAVRLARAEGHDVQCDMIPYKVGPGLMSAILPAWASQGSTQEIQARLRDRIVRKQLVAESNRYWFLFHDREWDKLTLTVSSSHPEWVGMTLRQIGESANKDPFECVFDILADEGEGMDQVWINGELFSEGDVAEWIADPLFSIASDGFTTTEGGPLSTLTNHPNCYGWTPTVVQKYVRELCLLSLESAIRKTTSMPAQRFGLMDRGILRPGMYADVIVFDEERFTTASTYGHPHIYAQGMEYVLVNGRLALQHGTLTGDLAGRVLPDESRGSQHKW
jgi:N-acyl-D-amino-acid deacylase